jgi:hypothetical protein
MIPKSASAKWKKSTAKVKMIEMHLLPIKSPKSKSIPINVVVSRHMKLKIMRDPLKTSSVKGPLITPISASEILKPQRPFYDSTRQISKQLPLPIQTETTFKTIKYFTHHNMLLKPSSDLKT